MNTSKKIISIVIAVLMLTVCIAFTASAADEVITEASATITEPAPGEYLDMNPVSGDESKYTVTVEHCYAPYDSTYDESKPFNYNTEYRVRILFTPKTGYTFDSSTVYKVNDQTNTGNTGYDGRLREAKFRTPYPSTPEGFEYRIENNGIVLIMGYHGTEKNVVIPAEIEGKRVIEIYYEAFYGVDVKSIHIPAGVMWVEDAFMGCTTLESITVDENSTAFTSENGVLFSKDKAILVAYPAAKKDLTYTVPDTVKSLWTTAFAFNTNIKEVIIPEGVEEISYDVFWGCSSLEKLEIPDSVTSIRSDALDGTAYYNNADNWENGILYCGNHLIKAKETVSGNYSIRPGTKTVAWRAFKGCDNLTGIEIPDGVVYIGFRAFDGCKSLKSVTVPGSVKIIDESAFQNCTELEAVTIGSGVESIEYCAFYKCESLKTVNLGKGLKKLGYESFGYCENLESIVIPDGVETIGHFAFSGCTKLASVTLPDSVEIIRSDVFENTAYYNDASNWVDGALYINNHLIKADVAGDYTVKEGTKTIASEAFYGNSDLNSVTLPDSLIGIGGGAFAGTNISDISIPSGVEYLGWNIVSGTPYANNPSNWENGLMYIDNCLIEIDSAYTGACRIKDVTRLIAEAMFYENEGVTSVVIPEGITEISDELFMYSAVKSITIPASVKSIGNDAFYGSLLETVNYIGAENSWNKIDFGRYNAEFHFAKVNFLCPHKNTSTLKAVAPTCTKEGKTEGKKCTACGVTTVAQKTVAKKAHAYKNVTTKATLSKNGKVVTKCSVCGNVSKTTTVYYPKTIKLSKTEYTYNGKVQTPSVTVKDSKGNTLKNDTDYTVKYESGRKAPGKYTVTITFKGKYEGTKKLTYTIAPKKVTKLSASQTTTTITLKWSKVTGADGYRVYKYNSKTKKYVKLKDVTKNTLKISKLKAGTTYKYKVRAYTKDDGSIYGAYSDVFATATKCKTPSISKLTSSKKGVASLTWTNVSGESGYQVYYSTKKDSGYKKVASYKTNVVKGSKKKLESGKKYYFKVRAYKKTASGTVYSSWSAVKSVKIK